jgi:AraC family transcriptional regulator, regulatory protein of adaptative response / methylated-DNA-[protein]-cysteine methyltransferase
MPVECLDFTARTGVSDASANTTLMIETSNACAANAIALAIPCHRMVRSDGTLSGYRWGVERKRALLAREAQV